MKSILYIIIAIFFTTQTSCKKEKETTEDEITPVPSLAWTQMEKDSIQFGDTTQMMRVYLTTSLQDSMVLRKKSMNVIPDTNDVVLMTLVRRMKKAMLAESGVGIAAPQVGINRNIIWVKRQDKAGKPNEVYLNAKIIMTSELTINFNGDGCLSVPNLSGKTLRWRAVGVEYDLLDGTHHQEVVDGYTAQQFTAVCFQHEIDHLNGILFVDRIVL